MISACSEDSEDLPSTPDGGGSGGSGGALATGGMSGADGQSCADTAVDTSEQCDVVTQDCSDPCTSRCVLYRPPRGTGYLEPACAPVTGDGVLFDACDRASGSVGDDSCAEGFFCSIGVGRLRAATSTRVCLPYCHISTDCDADSFCVLSTLPPTPRAGYCAKRCDPFADECATGDHCVKFQRTDDGDSELACSNQIGTLTVGASCAGGSCARGLSCETLPGGSGPVCTPFCDGAHPCDNGALCSRSSSGAHQVCGLPTTDAGTAQGDSGADAATDAATNAPTDAAAD